MTARLGVTLRLSASLALIAAMAGARADVLTDHAQVHVQGLGVAPLYQLSQRATGDLDSHKLTGSDASGFDGSGRARVSLHEDRLLVVEASSSGPAPTGTATTYATAWSRAIWRDAATVNDPSVDTLRFRFDLAGTLAVSDVSGGAFTPRVSRAYLAAFANGDNFDDVVLDLPGTPTGGDGWSVLVEDLSSLFPSSNGHRALVSSDWIEPDLTPTAGPGFRYAFEGSFEVVSRRLTGVSSLSETAFPLLVGLDVVASNRGGTSAASFAGALRLVSVTDGAGRPILPGQLRFASGLQPIPEPATWALLLPGLLPLAWASARRAR